jgi:phage tail-like protein
MSMATQRANPYGNANFVVEINGVASSAFTEVRLPDSTIDLKEYRTGNDKVNAARKLPALAHFSNLVLTRGFNGNLDLYAWWKSVLDGNAADVRNISIVLEDEAGQSVARWNITGAFPVRYACSTLVANGCEVLAETVELACQGVALE